MGEETLEIISKSYAFDKTQADRFTKTIPLGATIIEGNIINFSHPSQNKLRGVRVQHEEAYNFSLMTYNAKTNTGSHAFFIETNKHFRPIYIQHVEFAERMVPDNLKELDSIESNLNYVTTIESHKTY